MDLRMIKMTKVNDRRPPAIPRTAKPIGRAIIPAKAYRVLREVRAAITCASEIVEIRRIAMHPSRNALRAFARLLQQ